MKVRNAAVVMAVVAMAAIVSLGDVMEPWLYAAPAESSHGAGSLIQFVGAGGNVVAETKATPAFDVDEVRIGYISSPLTYLELDHKGTLTPVLYDSSPDEHGSASWLADDLESIDMLTSAVARPHMVFGKYAEVVPEPGSAALMCAAAGAVFFVRRVLLI